jgi:putative transposase
MRESSNPIVSLPAATAQDVLTSILRVGAQRLLTEAVEAEVAEWIARHRHLQDEWPTLTTRNAASMRL